MTPLIAAGLITFREGLEASLIVGIVLGYLRKIGRSDRRGYVWGGVLAALLVSLVIAVGLQFLGARLEGDAEDTFEGATMFLAVGVLTYMVFWMRYQARFVRVALERDIEMAVSRGQNWALFGLTFVAVLREGVETALFLTAAAFVITPAETTLGGVAGLGIAVLVGYLIYATAVRLPVGRFFDVTSVLLLIFAAGLLAHGVHEFQSVGLIPMVVPQVWDMNWLLDENSPAGSVLKAVVGYNGNPSLIEVASYVGYWTLVVVSVRWWVSRQPLPAAEAS
ncbi:MAG: FTR1 family protein [Anaerolineae bacterium]